MLKIFCDSTDRLEDYVKAMLNKCVKDNCHSAWNASAEAYLRHLRKYEDWRNAKFDCDEYDWKLPAAQQDSCPQVPQLAIDRDNTRTDYLRLKAVAEAACGTGAN